MAASLGRAGFAALCLFFGGLSAARAVVVAPPPGLSVTMLDERVLLVYDPLTGSQTMVVQHTFAGTAAPFGLLVPVPEQATVRVHPERLRRAIDSRLHPRGRVQRTLDVELVSVAASCALRDVGDGVRRAGQTPPRPSAAHGEPAGLGAAPEPLHDWLLENGFTVAPAQAAWLHELRSHGWGIVAVVVQPPSVDGAPPKRLRGPVLSITHESAEPLYAARHPPFALVDDGQAAPRLEVAVLTEWAVNLDIARPPAPFFADALTEKAVNQLSNDAGGLPWAFRREGNLTAFEVPRPSDSLGIVRFTRTDPWPTIRPNPAPQVRANTFELPVEVVLLLVGFAVWSWRRQGRRRVARSAGRLS
ncbi:MAG: DUF2330 domain-containing protein [bacterium]|nr:DUF2330 domain-containing protein [Myxococcales bacterium]MCB9552418.1 DUF2330 domain-containing protein [Myxococcales bacterium]